MCWSLHPTGEAPCPSTPCAEAASWLPGSVGAAWSAPARRRSALRATSAAGEPPPRLFLALLLLLLPCLRPANQGLEPRNDAVAHTRTDSACSRRSPERAASA